MSLSAEHGGVTMDINGSKSNNDKNQAMAASVSWGVTPTPFIYAVHLIGLISAVLVLIWNIRNRGGLAWNSDNKDQIFNIHPVLMVIGFIFVSSEAILVYKSVPGTKKYRKGIHLILQGIALVLAIVGISAAIKFHNEKNIDNFYSLHSWLGIGTVILFFLQWVAGFVTFWYPGAAASTRSSLLPWHVFFGVFVYVLAIATAQTGVLEKVTFLQSSKVFGHYDSEAFLANFLGIATVLLGVFTVLAAVVPSATKHEDDYRALQ